MLDFRQSCIHTALRKVNQGVLAAAQRVPQQMATMAHSLASLHVQAQRMRSKMVARCAVTPTREAASWFAPDLAQPAVDLMHWPCTRRQRLTPAGRPSRLTLKKTND